MNTIASDRADLPHHRLPSRVPKVVDNATDGHNQPPHRQKLVKSFEELVKSRKTKWEARAKSVDGANPQDAEDGLQIATTALWDLIEKNATHNDVCAEAVAEKALGAGIDPWMARVIHNAVTDVVRKMYALRSKPAKGDESSAPLGQTEKGEDETSRRRIVQMTDEHLALHGATEPDTTQERSEAQKAFIENARKWLTEDDLKAIDAKLRLAPPSVTWKVLAIETGETEDTLKQRASRAIRRLRTKLAELGYTSLGSI